MISFNDSRIFFIPLSPLLSYLIKPYRQIVDAPLEAYMNLWKRKNGRYYYQEGQRLINVNYISL